MSALDTLKMIHRRQAELLNCIKNKGHNLETRAGYFTTLSLFCRSCQRKAEQAGMMAERGLDAVYAATPPSDATLSNFRNMLRFDAVFYELWYELLEVELGHWLCAPPHSPNRLDKYPFGLDGFDDGYYKEKKNEAIANPRIVDREIKRFRDRLYAGFLAYGKENLKKCTERLNLYIRLPHPL